MQLEWLIGVALSVVGYVLTNFGTNLMKLGHNKILELPVPHPAYKNRSWQVGLFLFACGNVGSFYAYGYAAQSILAAIGCIQFVSNVVFAALVLKERVTRRILVATGLTLAGCVLMVVFGSHSSDKYEVDQLLQLYANPAYIAYLVVGGAAVAVLSALYWWDNRQLRVKHARHPNWWAAAMPVIYSVASALVCTQGLIFNKAVMVLWRMTLAGDNQLDKWATWLMALAFLILCGLWVVQLNRGLQLYDSLIIVPCMQLCFTLFGVVSGLLYFQEYRGMTQLQTAMFVLGVAIVCLSAGALARASQGGSAAAAKHLHAEQEAAEHALGLKPMPDSFYKDVHRAPPAGGTDFKLQVSWQHSTGLSIDSMAASTTGSEESLLPVSMSLGAPAAVADRVVLPPTGSLDVGGVHQLARGGARRMSRLRTCSMPGMYQVPL